MTREEAIHYITHGETPLIEDFISKRDRPFKAKLKIRPSTGRHQFEFPPRGTGATKKKAATKKTTKKAAAKKKKGEASKKKTV